MSQRAIEIIIEAEEKARVMKASAVAAAKQAIVSAEDEGRTKVEQAAKRAADELKEKNALAQKAAEAEAKAVIENAAKEEDALRTVAQSRLSFAADHIVERIVNG